MAKSLAERIASARTHERVRLAELESLIEEARAEREQCAEIFAAASTESVDFALPESMREDAAARSDRYGRTAKALDSAIGELSALLEQKREGEAQKAANAAVDQVRARRAALVDRIRSEWPDIAKRAADLFEAIEANDAEMKRLAVHDASAEAEARGCQPLFGDVVRLTSIKIPALEGTGLLWPRPAPAPVFFDVGKAMEDARKDRERRALAAQEASEEHARGHGRYRLSTNIMSAELVRLPWKIADRLNLPRGIGYGSPWEGELAHTLADEFRSIVGLTVTALDQPTTESRALRNRNAMPVQGTI